MSVKPEEAWAELVAEATRAEPAMALAAHARASRRVAELKREGSLPAGVASARLAWLRDVTVEPMVASLVAELAVRGFAAEVELGPLGGGIAPLLQEDSFVRRGAFDFCLVLPLAERVLPALFDPGAAEPPEPALRAYLDHLSRFAVEFRGQIVVCNFALPDTLLAPRYQAQHPESGRYFVGRANRELAALTRRHRNVAICDLEALAAREGLSRFWSRRDRLATVQPFSASGLRALARELAEICALALARQPVKCIVVDCDNTLWEGVVGEDGLEGLQLGETYPGVCYQEFQRQLGQLRELGYLLALNSKNNGDDVRRVFEDHPGMVLAWDQLAAVRVNWKDKASNLESLAEELNLGLESFLFIDDSNFELEAVRRQLPQVRCVKVPANRWELPGLLGDGGVIDRLAVTDEDRKKSQMYAEERQRSEFQRRAADFEEYLRDLGMVLRFEAFDARKHVARAAQMTQKTNQFNLTTRRYMEPGILKAVDEGALIFLGALRDRFGDYGRIALGIVRPADGHAALDTFLMSCRAVGRGVEDVFLRLLMEEVRRRGYGDLRAEWIPTAKNALCAGFLEKNGFQPLTAEPGGQTAYRYGLDALGAPAASWISVERPTGRDGGDERDR